jgi:hypothetical protein
MVTTYRFAVWAAVATAASLGFSCSSASKTPEPTVLSSTSGTVNGMAITDEMIGRSRGPMKLAQTATDPQYGYSEHSPVMVGGGFGSGSDLTYKYLNGLRGPKGETIQYDRLGTCCPFKTPNSPFEGQGLLEVYVVTLPGVESPRRLYFNWYDPGAVLIPVGLSSAP